MGLQEFLEVARGDRAADLLIRNARLVNVFSGAVEQVDLAIWEDKVVGWGDYEAQRTWDAGELYLLPGLIDAHVHLESSMVQLREFARAVLPRGTTSIVTDCHEISNVLGKEGIRYMLRCAERIPLEVFVMLPSCVPATPMETAGAQLDAEDLKELLGEDKVIGLGEMMNYPGVVNAMPEVLAKLQMAGDLLVDGHAPLLSGKPLNAYIGAGITSDHECIGAGEAAEKLSKGMYLMIREGSTARNLEGLLPAVTRENSRRCVFATDDRNPGDLLEEGHMDYILRRAVSLGLDGVTAVRMATLNAAERFRLKGLGALAPGYQADLVVVEDLENFEARRVMKKGRWVAEGGRLLEEDIPAGPSISSTMRVAWEKIGDIRVKAEGERIRVIGLVPEQIVTEALEEEARVEDGWVVSDPKRDLAKICVFERHKGTGNVGIGMIKGFGLGRGALASTVAHDSHNLIVVGVEDADIMFAARAVEKMGGGQVVVEGERVLAELSLPVAGLISDLPLEQVKERVVDLKRAARSLGCAVSDPFMALSFMALPVIPELKITDRGLFDVNSFSFVSLFV